MIKPNQEIQKNYSSKNEGKFDQAILASTFIIQTQQGNGVAYFQRGKIYSALQEYGEAIKDYSSAISIDPNYDDAYNNRGNIYYKLQRYEKAINDYISGLLVLPNNPLSLTTLGVIYCILNELPLSREYLYRTKELLQNISPMDLQLLNLTEANLQFIQQLLNLLTELDTEISKIKEELTIYQRGNQITLVQVKDYFQQIYHVEFNIQNTLKSDYNNPYRQNELIQQLNDIIQEVNSIKSNYHKLEVEWKIHLYF